MQERRAEQRLALKAKVHAYVVDESSGQAAARPICTGWTHDVSFAGVRFLARKPLPLNTVVDLAVACSRPQESCRLRGQVSWLFQEDARGYHLIGVYVQDASKERLIAWRRLLERRGLAE